MNVGCGHAPREISIKAALEWAFGLEHAQLDFDDLRPDGHRPGRDTIATLMDRGVLGCQIDGGGRSRSSDDAEIIGHAGGEWHEVADPCAGLAAAVERLDWSEHQLAFDAT